MYEEHFGLSKNPFQSIAEGEAVFEGPEQKKVIAGLKTALTANDSIAVITGPVGVGKTTIVQRALEEAAPERLVARLGRTAVGSDELVDLLLAQFGVHRETTRRFECLKTFNRILNEHAQSGARVFIVIEDAERLGEDLLEELEALTAADGGESAGANIVLMGPQKLDKLIAKPALERLRQRIRLQQTLERFNNEEVELYLRHRINAAGGDYDAICENGTAMMVRRCSGGIPRVINGLCETALNVAADNKMTEVTPKIVFNVAVEVFGMAPGEAPDAQPSKPAPVAQPAARAAAQADKAPAVQQAPVASKPEPAAAKPAPVAKRPAAAARKPAAAAATPETPAQRPAPAADNLTDPTIPVAKVPAAAEPKPQAQIAPRAPKPPAKPATSPAATNGATAPAATPGPEASRLPDLQGLGVQDKSPAAAGNKPAAEKPLPELPPKFKFADEIVIDKNTKPKLPGEQKKADPPELPTLESDGGAAKIADQKPTPKGVPVPPSTAADDIPTLGDSARVERIAPAKNKPAPSPPKPLAGTTPPPAPNPEPPAPNPEPPAVEAEPAGEASGHSLEEPNPPAIRLDPKVDEPTASFAQVDHDMLDAALASLAVHDDEDGPDTVIEPQLSEVDEAPAPLPEVTLDKNIEAESPAPDPAELDRMAAELEQTKTLEEMSDKLAETLFGSEELEAISLKIREKAVPEESPVALESTEVPGAAAKPAPERPKPTAQARPPSAAQPPAAPKPPTAPKPAARKAMAGEAAAAPTAPPATNNGPQPEPIENQFNTSMTATLKTLNTHGKPPADDEDSEEDSGGLLSRLKNTFKS